jgi:hypothetical protein
MNFIKTFHFVKANMALLTQVLGSLILFYYVSMCLFYFI